MSIHYAKFWQGRTEDAYREVVRLEQENALLKAENERLRMAGTYLCSTMEVNGIHDNGDIQMHERAIALWHAAKGGQQTK